MFKSNLPKEYYVNKLTEKTRDVEQLQECIQTLRAQLAERCTNVNNNVNSDQIMANLMAQVDTWKHNIDKVFSDIRMAQENYYMMSSKEKLLKLRTKSKEHTEQNRKLFSIDGDSMKRVSISMLYSCNKFEIAFFRIKIDLAKLNEIYLLYSNRKSTLDIYFFIVKNLWYITHGNIE